MTKRYQVPRRGWIWLLIFAVFVVLALVRLAFYFGIETPVAPPATAPAATPSDASQSAPEATVTIAATGVPTLTRAPTQAPPTETATQGVSPSATPRPSPTVRQTSTAIAPSPTLFIPTPLPGERLSTIRYDQLPTEGQGVIVLIARGGPFSYRQDGSTFQNREGLLPNKPSGYYKEYTVETPGSSDRGARRIIAGQQGELYYTADHYASFRRVVP
jgi:ribonuclease T1